GLNDTLAHHYNSYTFVNTDSSSACVTVNLDAGGCGVNQIFSEAYLGSFNPASLCTNYLADIGGSPDPSDSYSFNVPAGATYVIVVNEVDQNTGCPGYKMTVSSAVCNPIVTPTATFTRTVTPTQTRTPVATATCSTGNLHILIVYADTITPTTLLNNILAHSGVA